MTKKHRRINKLSKELNKAKKRIARYELGIQRGEHTKIDALETVKKQLDLFDRLGLFTKKGDLRKNISKSSLTYVESFTRGFLLNKKSDYNKYKTVKSRTQNIPHIITNLAKEWKSSEREVRRFISASTRLQNMGLLELLGLGSEQVRDLVEDHEDVSLETLQKVSEYLIKDKKRNVPSIMSKFQGEDDYYLALQEILNRVQNLDEKLKHASIEKILAQENVGEEIAKDKGRDYTKNIFGA